ncbi:MAG: hypothetical protein KIT02_16840 [Devosia sp.]|uniref:protein-disulfide reductase DsbD domain-containing protein n=1 Tax=Devosia sp. TaxID=1871048 RepID=UPI0024C6815D|nr:protein-disulfide reductase DsbD domain-containing protein [Devosia sp.]UYN99547.1 MAG: hypothetical protein KIT02_16840 [Devosia sp.]
MRPFVLALSALLPLLTPAMGGETPWQELAPDVHLRLISSGTVADGKTMVALELDMPESIKTYWRVPGEAGLPTELDLSASSGAGDYTQLWPYPERYLANGYLDYVYRGHTILPVEVAVTDPAGTLTVGAVLGVCSDVCVPAQASFSLALSDAAPDRANGLRIRQALAEVPLAWSGSQQPVGAVEAGDGAILVAVDPALMDPESLIAATADGQPVFGAPQKSPQPDLVVLPILGKTDDIALDGLNVELTFLTESGAYAVNRVVGETSGGAGAQGSE